MNAGLEQCEGGGQSKSGAGTGGAVQQGWVQREELVKFGGGRRLVEQAGGGMGWTGFGVQAEISDIPVTWN